MSQILGNFSEGILILGILLTLAGALLRTYRQEKEPLKGKGTATVVELIADEPDARGKAKGIHDYFYPVFAYYANGHLMKVRYREGSNPPKFYRGQKLQIKYDLKEPENFELVRPEKPDRLERVLYFAGIICILAGFACYALFALRVLGR